MGLSTGQTSRRCTICGIERSNANYTVREMMFGTRKIFTYAECPSCHCLQLADIPEDMSSYYPDNYYSITVDPAKQLANPVTKIVKRIRNTYAVFGKGVFGRIVYGLYPNEMLWPLSRIHLNKSSKILDVGCGAGASLYALRDLGFDKLLGVDPYISHDIVYQNGLKILKKELDEVGREWDVVLFHHSFEHLSHPLSTLQTVSRILARHGLCIIIMPTFPSYAWEVYGIHWVQLDAPRHIIIHSRSSLAFLGAYCGMTLVNVIYNSTAFQFWGSEQYARDIPLTSDVSYWINPAKSIFSRREIKHYANMAVDLNAEGRGDTAIFYLQKD